MPSWIEASLRDAVLALTRSGQPDIAASLCRLLEEPEVAALKLYRSRRASELADELFDCDSLDDLTRLLRQTCSVFCVSHCTILRLREREIGRYGPKLLSTYPDDWLSLYIARRYFSVDPVVAKALEEPGAFFWDEVVREDPITASFLRDAAAHEVGPAGITFAADNANGDRVAVSLAIPVQHAAFRELFADKLSDFADIARLLIDVHSDFTCPAAHGPVALTDDQLKVLKALASGRPRAEVETSHVAYGSFSTLERSILQALNATSIVQAVAIAAGRRLLETLPFSEEDIYRQDAGSEAEASAA